MGLLGAQALLCVIAVGLGSLTGSRAASLTALIGWQVIAGPAARRDRFLGDGRDAIPNIALGGLKPGHPLPDNNGVTMGAGLARRDPRALAVRLACRGRLADSHPRRLRRGERGERRGAANTHSSIASSPAVVRAIMVPASPGASPALASRRRVGITRSRLTAPRPTRSPTIPSLTTTSCP